MKTILLFGSSGFIGGAIAEYFGKKKDVRLIAPNRKDCNLLKYREVKNYMKHVDPDIVINAAYIEVNSNVKPTKKYLSDNLKISKSILKACKGKTAIQKIIFFGSGLEYGDSKKPIDESHSKNPKNYYAKTKAIQSDASLSLAKKLQLPFVLLKPFNLYGPHDNKSVLFYVIKSILEKKDFAVTKGEQIRDILYIEDFMKLIEKVVTDKKNIKAGDVLNVGYGKGVYLKDAIDEICKALHYKGTYGIRDYRNNEYFSQVVNITKAKKLLQWEPSVTLQEGIKKTVDWVKKG